VLPGIEHSEGGPPLGAACNERPKRSSPLALEREPQAEFDLTRCAERVDAGAHAHAIHVVSGASGAVDLPCGSCQQSI